MILLGAIVTGAFIALCLGVIYFDLKHMRIPDGFSIGFVALFSASVVVFWPDIAVLSRLITAAIVFAITFALFAFRVMGGGDTKVIPTMALFVPTAALSNVVLLFAACLLLSILAVVALRNFAKAPPYRWAVLTNHKLPMGVAIGTTGIVGVLLGN